jgi:hypothetical protein
MLSRVLLVGIENYPGSALPGCLNDVAEMNSLFTSLGVPAGRIIPLLDSAATRDAIATKLQQLISGLSLGQHVAFFYSGHGCRVPQYDQYGNVVALHDGICPYDFDQKTGNPTTAICDVDFQKLFSSLPSGATLAWICDSCFAGGYLSPLLAGPLQRNGIDKALRLPLSIQAKIDQLEQQRPSAVSHLSTTLGGLPGVALFAACSPVQRSQSVQWPAPNGPYGGVFTRFLVAEMVNNGGVTKPSMAALNDISSAVASHGYPQTPQFHGDPRFVNVPVFL